MAGWQLLVMAALAFALGGCKLGHSRPDAGAVDRGPDLSGGGSTSRSGASPYDDRLTLGSDGDEDAGGIVQAFGRPGGCEVRHPDGPMRMPARVVLIVGDGMGPEQVASARAAAGGELAMDALSYHTRVATDSQTTLASGAATDSAAAASAMATGVPVFNGRIGAVVDGVPMPTALDLAQAAGRATGLVTTSYLHDATPMSFAVVAPDRFADASIVDALLSRQPVDVLMGGGAAWLTPAQLPLRQRAEGLGYRIATDRESLLAVSAADAGHVLGLFVALPTPPTPIGWRTTPAHRRTGDETDPSLAEMATYALQRLSQDPDGFFLLVEDETTDELGHLSGSYPELTTDAIAGEVRYLDAAVGAVIEWVEANGGFAETLVIVTADHETGAYQHDPARPGGGDFFSTGHTRTPVDVFARGPGAEQVGHMCWLGDVFQLMTGQLRPR